MSDWIQCTWGDIATLEYGKGIRDYKVGSGLYPVFGTNGQIGWHTTYLWSDSGVIIGRKGAYRGVHYSKKPFYVIDTAFYLKPKASFDMRWAYYELLTHDINGLDSGSAIPSTNREDFYRLPVMLPTLPAQRRIAEILGRLDDKIEVNRRINRTLEAMAQALYKHWFVDFGPFQDGEFVESELGLIPQGWRVGELQEIAEIIMGASPKGDTYNQDGIGTPLINGPVEFGEYFAQKTKWTTEATKLSQKGDLIFCVRGSTTGKRVIADDRYALGRGVCAIRAYSERQAFVNQTIHWRLDGLLSKTSGSVFPSLSSGDIKRFSVLVPPEKSLEQFCDFVNPMLRQIWTNIQESNKLTEIRDYLLPKLLSGEIPVEAATEQVDEVTEHQQQQLALRI